MAKPQLIVLALLCGCGAINDKGIDDAIKACAAFGGVAFIGPVLISVSSLYKVTCKDGKTIEGRGDK